MSFTRLTFTKLVDNFLSNARKSVLNDRAKRNGFSIVSEFSIENKQLTPFATNANRAILNSRYWLSKPFQTRLFNDYIYFSLRKSILKSVINNELTGSSWHFKRILYINVNILDNSAQILR